MKKITLLLFVSTIAAHVDARQKNLDSLLNELKKHTQEDTVRLNILHSISLAYQPINPNKGIIISNEEIALARKLNNEIGLGKALNTKGVNYMVKGEYDSCLMLLKPALQILKNTIMSTECFLF